MDDKRYIVTVSFEVHAHNPDHAVDCALTRLAWCDDLVWAVTDLETMEDIEVDRLVFDEEKDEQS